MPAYVYAVLLLDEQGAEVTGRRVADTLESVGIDVDPERVETLDSAAETILAESSVEENTTPTATIRHLQTEQDFEIEPGYTIGRAGADGPTATITISGTEEEYITSIQMQFERNGDAWYLIDRSLNGTYVNSGEKWRQILCEAGQERLDEEGVEYTEHGGPPSESTQLQDGDLIAPVHPTYGVTFEFRPE